MNHLPVSPALLALLGGTVVIIGLLLVIGRVPLSYNVRNLVVRWPMSVLTGLAFTLVVLLVTVMMAFVNGLQKVTEQTGHPDNVVVLSSGANDETFSNLGFRDTSNLDNVPGVMRTKIGDKDKALCSREVYIVATMPIPPLEGTAAGQHLRGKVRKVLIDDKAFILTDEHGNDRTFHLADDGKVIANKREGKIENLRPEDNVWVAYDERGKDAFANEVQGSNRRMIVQVRGIEDPAVAANVHRMELVEGRWFSDAGVEDLPREGDRARTAVQAVVGQGFARVLGGERGQGPLHVGDLFDMGSKRWKIVGIMKSAGTTFDAEVWAKRSYVGVLYGKPSTVSSVTIRSPNPEEAAKLADFLTNDYKDVQLLAQTETDYYDKARGVSLGLLLAIEFLTFFMAIGGIFGVMNTMFAAISQRVKDIGVLRIVGYARWQILVSFLLESLVIALIGGLLGCALGSLCNGISATSVVGTGQGFGQTVIFRLSVGPNTIAIGLLLTLLMGLLGGLLPSLSAMRLRPLEAMR